MLILTFFTAVYIAALEPQRFGGPQGCFSATLLSAFINSSTLASAQDADVMIDESYMRDAMECG